MADDPQAALWKRLLRRVLPKPPEPSYFTEDETPKRRRDKAALLARRQPERAHVRVPFHTGQPGRPARRAPKRAFEDHSDSGSIKRDQAFNRRFKGEVARTEALDAINDAAIVRAGLQKEHIERLREWKEDLRFFTSGSLPVPAEAGRDINRRHDELFARFDREMQEVEDQLNSALEWAESLDLAEDRRRQKLLTYAPKSRDVFRRAAAVPEWAAGVMPEPRPSRTVLDHPFNDAATQPAPARPTAEPAFNDAATAPDPLAVYLAKFAPPEPGAARPAVSIDR